ncbi:MAG: LUD domain-containing protein [Niastella sp.]|nr:LUD domain-containing protein [Niastella sp.]
MSREKILAAAKQNKPALVPLPEVTAFTFAANDLLAAFTAAINKAGGAVMLLNGIQKLAQQIQEVYPDAKRIANLIDGDTAANKELLNEVALLDVVVLKGQLGVAENGAVWLTDKDCVERVLPFITQHLILLIEKQTLVGNMHQAYAVMGKQNPDYGVFIAGPSKTADIEQSLVIGAHGPRSLQVFIVEQL